MKLVVVITIALVVPFVVHSQDENTRLIEIAIRDRKNVERIVYLDSSFSGCEPISRLAKNGTLTGYKDTSKVVTLKLSPNEIRFIDSGFKAVKRIPWTPNMFANSVMMCRDSVQRYFRNNEGYDYFKNVLGPKFFLFSPPVMIRRNTIAIIHLGEFLRPDAGTDLLCVYQKVSGNWRHLMWVPIGFW